MMKRASWLAVICLFFIVTIGYCDNSAALLFTEDLAAVKVAG